jgi:hypothetical protein
MLISATGLGGFSPVNTFFFTGQNGGVDHHFTLLPAPENILKMGVVLDIIGSITLW